MTELNSVDEISAGLEHAVTTVSRAVARESAAHSADAFGVMGNGNALFVDALEHEGVRYHPLRHEAGAVAAADAYSRTTGSVGVATTTFGAGFTNVMTALADAVRARSAVVVITGDAPTAGRRSADVDLPALVRAVGATSWTITPGREVDTVRRAFRSAQRDARPAVVSIPYDLVASDARDVGEDLAIPEASSSTVIPRDIVDLVVGAERLLVLAGRGAVLSGAQGLATRFVTQRSAASATTAMAHGLFDGLPSHLGIAGGFGSDHANSVMGMADVVLVLGAGLNGHTTRNGSLFDPEARVIQVDIGAAPTAASVTHHLQMDISDFLRSMLAMPQLPPPPAWVHAPSTTSLRPSAGGLHPQVISAQIASHLPEDVTVVLDGGNFMAWPLEAWPVKSSDAFVPAGLAYQSIGLGLPAMIGAAVGRPDRLPVLAVGDGGMLMALADLESAARLVHSGLIVVYNDAVYGAELHQYASSGVSTRGMRFPVTDFAAMAQSVGMRASTIRSPADLVDLQRWIQSGAPGVMLLDCRIADDVRAPFFDVAGSAVHASAGRAAATT